MSPHIKAVPLEKSYRLVNHGPTVLVSAEYNGIQNVMAAAWCCGLDFAPPKLTVVVDSGTKTRELIDGSGLVGIMVPTVAQLDLTYALGSITLNDDPDKLKNTGTKIFKFSESEIPFVDGCSAYMACKVIEEQHIQKAYDLFVLEIVGAWADERVFKNGHWEFSKADPSLRSLHHVAGGNFFAIGEEFKAKPV